MLWWTILVVHSFCRLCCKTEYLRITRNILSCSNLCFYETKSPPCSKLSFLIFNSKHSYCLYCILCILYIWNFVCRLHCAVKSIYLLYFYVLYYFMSHFKAIISDYYSFITTSTTIYKIHPPSFIINRLLMDSLCHSCF